MVIKAIRREVVHSVPRDLQKDLAATPKILDRWNDLTPLARNEWLCWVLSAKKSETRVRRIHIMFDKLKCGERRPCCWVGCPHRL